eukprot:9333681-Pyramimonas_sp.AAC.1
MPSWASWTPWRAAGACQGTDRASKTEGGAWARVPRVNVPGGTIADQVHGGAEAVQQRFFRI